MTTNRTHPDHSVTSLQQSRRGFLKTAVATGLSAAVLARLVEPGFAQDGQSVTLTTWLEPATLLSGAPVTGASYQQIQSIIANGLTKLGHPEFDVQPDLAESWEVSDDGLVHDFTLRTDVTWQDGEPFTAEDVKFTYDLVSHAEFPGALDSYFLNIEGAQANKAGDADELVGVEIVDDNHVRFTLQQPDTLFLASTTSRQRILPKHILEEIAPSEIDKSEFARKPIYTGPFIVQEWRAGDSISFQANPDYFGGKPAVDTLIARFISDQATALAELQTGTAHAGLATPDQFGGFIDSPDLQTLELPGLRVVYIQFDLITTDLFVDERLRKAISHAIDRQTVIDALYLGMADPATNFVPEASIYYTEVPQFGYDLEQANALLDEAGWTLGDDGVRVNENGDQLQFTLTVPTAYLLDGLAIQPFLQAIGINVEIEELAPGQITGPLSPGDYQAAIGAWNNFIIDPRADLQRFFQTPRPADQTGYQNPEVDELILQARSETNADTEQELWGQVQQLIAEDASLALLWRQRELLLLANQLNVPEVTTLSEWYARIPEWSLDG